MNDHFVSQTSKIFRLGRFLRVLCLFRSRSSVRSCLCYRILIANIPILLQFIQKRLVRTIDLWLKIKRATRLGIICFKILLESLKFSKLGRGTSERDVGFTSSRFMFKISRDSEIEMPFRRDMFFTTFAAVAWPWEEAFANTQKVRLKQTWSLLEGLEEGSDCSRGERSDKLSSKSHHGTPKRSSLHIQLSWVRAMKIHIRAVICASHHRTQRNHRGHS